MLLFRNVAFVFPLTDCFCPSLQSFNTSAAPNDWMSNRYFTIVNATSAEGTHAVATHSPAVFVTRGAVFDEVLSVVDSRYHLHSTHIFNYLLTVLNFRYHLRKERNAIGAALRYFAMCKSGNFERQLLRPPWR
jgi:hypothetical protein